MWKHSSVVFFSLILAACRGPIPELLVADTILVNGNVITVDAQDTVAQALAIKNGRILAVGTDAEIRRLAGEDTRVIDLAGRTATPGLLDAHCHFAWGGTDMLEVSDLSYPKVKSITDVLGDVETQVQASRGGDWIQGRGWDEGKLEERRYIYASDLDAISAENPVWLTHTMGHYGVANSLALKLAKIDRNTPDPPGGTIDRHPDGTPTGVLKERAQGLVTDLIPAHTVEQIQKGIEHIAKEFHKEGMTGLKDPGIGALEWEAYQRALGAGNLPVRAFILWRAGQTLEEAQALAARIGPFTKPYRTTGDSRLISGGIKMMIDGSGGARTAWLHEPWNKEYTGTDEGNYGYPVIPPEVLRSQIRMFHDAGMHVSVHSIGDRAIDWVVDSYAMAFEANPQKGLRHGIIHANIPTEHAIDTIARLQAEFDAGYPEPSAPFMWWIGDTYSGNFGPVRSKRLNPFKTFLSRNVRWAGASDFDVTPFPARFGIWSSVARKPALGVYDKDPFGRDEAVDVRTALRSYTIWSAHQLFLEDEIGSLEPGKYADIAVWDKNLYEVPTEELETLECQMTLFQGEVVFER
jgi:predicted amidohydrolase YtcJ